MKSILYPFAIFGLIFIVSCQRNRLDVAFEKEKLTINFVNVDSIEFQSSDRGTIKEALLNSPLNQEEILSYQFQYCIGVGAVDDDTSYLHLDKFVSDPYFVRVHQAVKNQLYPELPRFNKELLDGFKRWKFHDASFKTPTNIAYINSAFSSSIFSTENEIGVSLERYLSDSNQVISELPSEPFYEWVKKKFSKEYLVRDVFLGWTTTHLVDIEKGNLADRMIAYGKALYLTKAAMPKAKDALILRYSKEEYKWARENERNFWDYLVQQKMLYTTSEREQTNFLNDGPYTTGLPENGPDRLGQFLGYQMVLQYVEKNSKLTLRELVNLPSTEIIKKYKI